MNSKRIELKRIEYTGIFLLLILVLVTIAYLKNANAAASLVHSIEVKNETQKILNAIQNTEIGHRGYLLTQDTSYLAPYHRGLITFEEAFAATKILVEDSPSQLQRLRKLDSLARLKFIELELSTDRIKQGALPHALSILKGRKSEIRTEEITSYLASILAEENQLLAQRQRNFTIWKYIIALLLVVSLLMLLRALFSLYQKIEPLFIELESTKESLQKANANIAESLYKLRKLHNEQEVNIPILQMGSKQDDTFFYRKLKQYKLPLESLLGKPEFFQSFPENWQIVVVDIEKSTQAVDNGLHQEVNLAATGSIVAVFNHLKAVNKKIMVPYFFGGDGVTFIMPASVTPEVLKVLENYRHHVRKNMYLSLKVGSIRVGNICKDGRSIKIAKYKVNSLLTVPIVLGTGLKHAERVIKSYFVDETSFPNNIQTVELDGMECRWQEVQPPRLTEKIICLVAECPYDDQQAEVYRQLLQHISKIFGSYEERQPISIGKLKLDLRMSKINKEMHARLGRFDLGYLLKNWLITVFGKSYFKYFEAGKSYINKVQQLSYTLMIDGTFNCVISGTPEETQKFIELLDQMESDQLLKYGIHITRASVMSCYVEDRKNKHIHFVDGTEGGYTTAAKMFKAKSITL